MPMQIKGKTALRTRVALALFIALVAACCVLTGCGGGNGAPLPPSTAGNGGSSGGSGGTGGSGSGGNGGSGGTSAPASTLSCNGYPMVLGTQTQVCLMTQQSVAATPSLSVTTNVGNLFGHGRDNLSDFTLYTQIIATAADEATATTLAKSVVVSAANASISATSNQVTSPESLSINFEVFTAPTTNLTLTGDTGNQSVDNYNATLNLKASTGDLSLQTVQGQATVNDQTGNVSLQTVQGEATINVLSKGNVSLETVQGQATVNVAIGNVDVTLSGSSWTGAGMKATTQTGNITVTRPAGYQAAFTAKADQGIASIDSQSVASGAQGPAIVTAGTGAPISIESVLGNATVTTPAAPQ